MASGDSGQIRIDGTMPLQIVVQGDGEAERKFGKVQEAIERVSSVFNKMSSGLDFSKYFKTAESSLKGVGDALQRVTDAGGAAEASRRDIEALLKSVNAFKASAILSNEDPGKVFQEFGQELSDAVSIAERRLPRIAQAFSVDEFKTAFMGLSDAVELFGHNYESIISKLNQASPGEYIRMVDEIRAKNAELESDVRQLKEELASIGAGNGSQLAKQIRDLQQQIEFIRNEAASEFKGFLSANELSPNDARFSELLDDIKNGFKTAREAIAACKTEYASLFDGQTDGLAEQLVTRFEQAATKIEELRTQVIQMRNDLANVGIGTSGGGIADEVDAETEALSREGEAVENVKKSAEGLGETAEIIRRLAEHLSVAGVGANAREVASSVSMMAESLKQLGDTDESKLSSIASALYSIQSMNGFSANSKALAALTQLLSDLSGIEHSGTSVLSSLSSMNLANLQNLKVSKAALENLKNNLPDIGKADAANIERLVNLPWENLSKISVDRKSIDALKGLTDGLKLDNLSVKFDETGLSSLSKSIEEAIQRASQNIKLTIDNVELSAAALKKATDTAQKAASGAGTKAGSAGASGTKDTENETAAIERQTEAMWKNHEAWRQAEEAKARASGWSAADALAKNEAALEREREAAVRAADEYEAAEARKANAAEKSAQKIEEAATKAANATTEDLAEQLKKLDVGASGIKFTEDESAMSRYRAAIESASRSLESLRTASASDRAQAVADTEAKIAAVRGLRAELNAAAKATSLAGKIDTFLSKNGRLSAETRSQLQGWSNDLKSGAAAAEGRIDGIANGFTNLQGAIRAAQSGGKTFFQTMKDGWSKFGGWSLVTKSFTRVISTFKQMVTAVKEVDSAMTELRKVTDLTAVGYERFYNNAAKMAVDVGAKLSDTINAVADFSRLGFTIDEASKLAEASLVYQNVGDGIESVSDATESLISTIKAFGIEAENAMSIVDMFNEVGNNFAISSTGIGEALQRSASALSAAGNTIEESIGLVVAANDVVQNPESVGEIMRPAA